MKYHNKLSLSYLFLPFLKHYFCSSWLHLLVENTSQYQIYMFFFIKFLTNEVKNANECALNTVVANSKALIDYLLSRDIYEILWKTNKKLELKEKVSKTTSFPSIYKRTRNKSTKKCSISFTWLPDGISICWSGVIHI